MIAATRNTIAVAIAVCLALLPLHELSRDLRLALAPLIVVVLQTIAGLLRRFSFRSWLPNTAQWVVLATGLAVLGLVRGIPQADYTIGRPLLELFTSAMRHVAGTQVPMPAQDDALILLLVGVAILTILVDITFIAGHSVLLAALPLLGGYLAAVAVREDPLWAGNLVALAVAWLVLLGSRIIDHDQHWPRGLTGRAERRYPWPAFIGVGLRLAVPAIAVALVAGLSVPNDGPHDWWPRQQEKTDVRLVDPTIELNENLHRPENRSVLHYQTSTGAGVYLRSSTLTAMDANGWRQIDMALSTGFPAQIPGLGQVQPDLTTHVQIGELNSDYLPAPYAPLNWSADGLWRYDPASLTVLGIPAKPEVSAVANLDYVVNSRRSDPTSEQLAAAVAGVPPEGQVAREVPAGVPQRIIDLTSQVISPAATDGQRAVAIQDFLRDPALFSYSLTSPTGSGYDVLTHFLFTEHAGYCVHFSASMALMARIAGIPSRVAVGFTPGTRQDDGGWEVTSHNMHAWPELYFAGLGWVRFEPTLGQGAEPDYTDLSAPSAPPTQNTEPTPSQQRSSAPPPPPTPAATPPTQPAPPVDGFKIDLRWVFSGLGVLLVGAAPGLLRWLRRRRRLTAAQAPARIRGAWAELRDSAADLGIEWPTGTARQQAAHDWPGLDAAGRAGLTRIALLVEQLRFAAQPPTGGAVADDVRLVRQQWLANTSRVRRLLALVLPGSLFGAGRDHRIERGDQARS